MVRYVEFGAQIRSQIMGWSIETNKQRHPKSGVVTITGGRSMLSSINEGDQLVGPLNIRLVFRPELLDEKPLLPSDPLHEQGDHQ